MDPNASFYKFNEDFHARMIVSKEFLDRYRDRLTKNQIHELENQCLIEDQRYKGEWLQIIFCNNCEITNRMRNLFLCNRFMFSIKKVLEPFLIGWAMR